MFGSTRTGQLANAVGDGVSAALAAYRYLNEGEAVPPVLQRTGRECEYAVRPPRAVPRHRSRE